MHIISSKTISQILRHLTPAQCHTFITTLNVALTTVSSESILPPSDKLIHQPLRSTILTNKNNLSLFMPVSNTINTGVKVVTASTGGLEGVINIFDPEGRLEGVLNAADITAFRTALAVMTLFVRCTSLEKKNVVIFGAGRQAEWHARLALLLCGDIRRITFTNRSKGRLEKMGGMVDELRIAYPATEMKFLSQEGTPDYDEQLRQELADSNVIFSCTPSTQPNFPYAYLSASPKQRFISMIGSYKPHMREVDTETLLSGGKVYVDSKEACLEESGELVHGKVGEEQLVEVGGFYQENGSEEVQMPEGGNVVFKCVGMGIMDLAIGGRILEIARERGLGVEVDGF